MSAGQPPSNSGASRGNPSTPRSSLIARRGPLILASVAVGGAAYLFYSRRPPLSEGTPKGISTPGIRNIESAYTNAGATSTHTKAYGGTPTGSKDNENLREDMPAGSNAPRGFASGAYGDDQRRDDNFAVEKKLKEKYYGSEKGK